MSTDSSSDNIDALTEKNLESLLQEDEGFVDFFNNFLALPCFAERLHYNTELGVFEEFIEKLADDVGKGDAKAASQLRQFTHFKGTIYNVAANQSRIGYYVTVLDKVQGLEFVKKYRLHLFLRSELYAEYKLTKHLSTVQESFFRDLHPESSEDDDSGVEEAAVFHPAGRRRSVVSFNLTPSLGEAPSPDTDRDAENEGIMYLPTNVRSIEETFDAWHESFKRTESRASMFSCGDGSYRKLNTPQIMEEDEASATRSTSSCFSTKESESSASNNARPVSGLSIASDNTEKGLSPAEPSSRISSASTVSFFLENQSSFVLNQEESNACDLDSESRGDRLGADEMTRSLSSALSFITEHGKVIGNSSAPGSIIGETDLGEQEDATRKEDNTSEKDFVVEEAGIAGREGISSREEAERESVPPGEKDSVVEFEQFAEHKNSCFKEGIEENLAKTERDGYPLECESLTGSSTVENTTPDGTRSEMGMGNSESDVIKEPLTPDLGAQRKSGNEDARESLDEEQVPSIDIEVTCSDEEETLDKETALNDDAVDLNSVADSNSGENCGSVAARVELSLNTEDIFIIKEKASVSNAPDYTGQVDDNLGGNDEKRNSSRTQRDEGKPTVSDEDCLHCKNAKRKNVSPTLDLDTSLGERSTSSKEELKKVNLSNVGSDPGEIGSVDEYSGHRSAQSGSIAEEISNTGISALSEVDADSENNNKETSFQGRENDDTEMATDDSMFSDDGSELDDKPYDLATKEGFDMFREFLLETSGEKLLQFWLEVECGKYLENEDERNRLVQSLRDRFWRSGGIYEFSAVTKSRLNLVDASTLTFERLFSIQPDVLRPLLSYWCIRFTMHQQRVSHSHDHDYNTMSQDRLKSCFRREIASSNLPQVPAHVGLSQVLANNTLARPQSSFVKNRPVTQHQTSRPQVRAKSAHPRLLQANKYMHTNASTTQLQNIIAPVRTGYGFEQPPGPSFPVEPEPDYAPSVRLFINPVPSPDSKIQRMMRTLHRTSIYVEGSKPALARETGSKTAAMMDSLIQGLIYERQTGDYFKLFLQKSGNETWMNCLAFWKSLQEYNAYFFADSLNPSLLSRKARTMYANFVVSGSAQDVHVHRDIQVQVHKELEPPYEELFDAVEEHVLHSLLEPWQLHLEQEKSVFNAEVPKQQTLRHIEIQVVAKRRQSIISTRRGLDPAEDDHEKERISVEEANRPFPVPKDGITFESLIRNRDEVEYFKEFLNKKHNRGIKDLMAWTDMETFRRVPRFMEEKRDKKAKEIRENWLGKKYFFGADSPATRDGQNLIMNINGGRPIKERPQSPVILESQKFVRARIERRWLMLFKQTAEFLERQKPRAVSVPEMVEDIMLKRRLQRSEAAWKILNSSMDTGSYFYSEEDDLRSWSYSKHLVEQERQEHIKRLREQGIIVPEEELVEEKEETKSRRSRVSMTKSSTFGKKVHDTASDKKSSEGSSRRLQAKLGNRKKHTHGQMSPSLARRGSAVSTVVSITRRNSGVSLALSRKDEKMSVATVSKDDKGVEKGEEKVTVLKDTQEEKINQGKSSEIQVIHIASPETPQPHNEGKLLPQRSRSSRRLLPGKQPPKSAGKKRVPLDAISCISDYSVLSNIEFQPRVTPLGKDGQQGGTSLLTSKSLKDFTNSPEGAQLSMPLPLVRITSASHLEKSDTDGSIGDSSPLYYKPRPMTQSLKKSSTRPGRRKGLGLTKEEMQIKPDVIVN
ncbi:hypothetical protein pdam_00000335, partial [Pocillopora damicornis]